MAFMATWTPWRSLEWTNLNSDNNVESLLRLKIYLDLIPPVTSGTLSDVFLPPAAATGLSLLLSK